MNMSGGEGVDVSLLLGQFFRATIFLCRFFSLHQCLFWVDFTNICIFFFCILCVFHQKVKQCFGHKIFVMYN